MHQKPSNQSTPSPSRLLSIFPNIPMSLYTLSTEATSPLLNETSSRSPSRLGDVARLLGRMNNNRMLSQRSLQVRRTVAQQIEERRGLWANSKRIIILDLIWNMTIVVSAIIVINLSMNETPKVPLRLWILGYGVQCVIHMFCVCVEYWRRGEVMGGMFGTVMANICRGGSNSRLNTNLTVRAGADLVEVASEQRQDLAYVSVATLQLANTMFTFIWWLVGYYWVSSGGDMLEDDAPKLFDLAIIFLTFDMFLVIICILALCVIGIAICCFLPLFMLALCLPNEDGAKDEILETLTRYNFKRLGETEKPGDIPESYVGSMVECDTDTPTEHALSADDAACVICLCEYENGSELYELPCHHHFHCDCINNWLLVKSSCPLCKYDIPKYGTQSSGVV